MQRNWVHCVNCAQFLHRNLTKCWREKDALDATVSCQQIIIMCAVAFHSHMANETINNKRCVCVSVFFSLLLLLVFCLRRLFYWCVACRQQQNCTYNVFQIHIEKYTVACEMTICRQNFQRNIFGDTEATLSIQQPNTTKKNKERKKNCSK